MPSNTFPIVGAHFRPPAKVLIGALAVGTPLTLIAEPENPYDANAIAVWLYSKDIPKDAYAMLEENLPASGHSLEGVIDEEQWHLGYIPKEMAAELRARGIVPVGESVDVTFSVSASGAPRVRFAEAPY